MPPKTHLPCLGRILPHIVFSLSIFQFSGLHAQVPVADYSWKPVRIGAGGLVTGMSIHPLNSDVRFARTDVGNGYRWDTNLQMWQPIIVRNVTTTNGGAASTGFASAVANVPAGQGVESLVVDPANVNIVYIAFPLNRSNDVSAIHPTSSGALYKSIDGGLTFAKTGLNIPMQPNGESRGYGERIAIDPKNSSVLYYGSVSSGLRRSLNGGTDWSLVSAGAPAATANVINVLFDPVAPSIVVNGQTRTSVVYANTLHGETFRSADGGQTWSALTIGTELSGCTGFASIDRDGRLYVIPRPLGSYVNSSGATVYYHYSTNQLWRYTSGVWTRLYVRDANGYGLGGSGNIARITIDPQNTQRLFALSDGGGLTRTTNGGATWVRLSTGFAYTNTLAWLPQITTNPYRSACSILMDLDGRLWSAQGNEGVLIWKPSDADSEGADSNPAWAIDSKGIEELVAHEIVIPPGSGDKPVVTVEDASGFFIENPDQFTALQASQLQPGQLISNGIGLAYCPNAPEFIVLSSSDINRTGSGANYSGYSSNGGRSWTPFASRPSELQCGQIAVSARGTWGLGSDHIVALPATNKPPQYTKNGGQTWQVSVGLPLDSNANLADGGMFTFALRQHLLLADPFIPDKFYLTLIGGPLYVSTNGGANWVAAGGTGLPSGRFHSQMVANPTQSGDLWVVDGWEGASAHGLYRSTNSGVNFSRLPTVDYAINLALGKGRGQTGDATYTVYIYGKVVGDSAWGVFRSTDAGASWTRVAFNPAGLFDIPSSMAASWDTFGLLYIGYRGNSFVYGKPQSTVFDFETTSQGWVGANGYVTSLTTSTEKAYSGARSLKISVTKTSTNLEGGSIRIYNPQAASGKTVTFRVWLPANITGTIDLVAYTQFGGNWEWQSSHTSDPVLGAWNTLTLAVPITNNVQSLGLWLRTSNPLNEAFYLDSVAY